MNNIIQDIIHLTKMEFVIKYWCFELGFIVLLIVFNIFDYRRKVRKLNAKYDKLDNIFKK